MEMFLRLLVGRRLLLIQNQMKMFLWMRRSFKKLWDGRPQ
jgi:hypothetical protein